MSIKKYVASALLSASAGIIASAEGGPLPTGIKTVACAVTPAPDFARSVKCFELAIPIDRLHPSRAGGAMSFVVVPALNSDPGRLPLLFLMGGNGAGTGLIARQPALISALSKRRDLILIDHRGAGSSRPGVICPGFHDAVAVSMASVEQLRDCSTKLRASGINVNLFGPAQAAVDIRELRLALGIQTWDLYAISYGTRIAKSLMDIDPNAIRSAVLDGVYGWNTNAWSLGDILEPVIGLFDRCQADPECGSAFPDLEGRLARILTRLQSQPESLHGRSVGAVAFMTGIQRALGVPDSRRMIPLAIDQASRGKFDVWEQIAPADAVEETAPGIDPSLTFYGQACREEFLLRSGPVQFPPPTRRLPKIIAESTQLDWPGSMKNLCELLGYRPAAASELAARSISIPTLMPNGEIDMNTPLHAAQRAQRYFTQFRSVTFPLTGHWVLRRDHGCAIAIVDAFYLAPTAPPDTACVEAMPTLRWATARKPT